MKKSFTLLAIAALITSASFAQPNDRRDKNYGYNNDREIAAGNHHSRNGTERGTYYFSARERDMQIASINRDYYRKMESVRNKLFMGRSKKEYLIHSLDMQRKAEIHSVIARFNDRRNSIDRRDRRYNDRDRRNNW